MYGEDLLYYLPTLSESLSASGRFIVDVVDDDDGSLLDASWIVVVAGCDVMQLAW